MSPRRARSQMEIYTYFHVCSRGNGGQVLFQDDLDRLRYLSLVERYRARYGLRCLAYCLMTNHTHLLFLVPSLGVLSKAVHGLHVSYVRYFNHRHNRNGHLFQDRFSSWVIEHGDHLLATKEYIENNPVKTGLVKLKQEFRWSSSSGDGSDVTIELIVD